MGWHALGKYNKIELVESSLDYRVFRLIDYNKFNRLLKKYGNREIKYI